MKKSQQTPKPLHQKFLEFNGNKIIFLNADGQYWIALKPICEILNVNYNRQFQNLKSHRILSGVFAKQQTHDSINRLQEMICLPEKYIYGWLFSLNSNSPELLAYQNTCYELLYDHFHGTITNRKELLMERNDIDTKIFEIKKELKQDDEKYKVLKELETKRKKLSTQLNSIDKELVQQPELFSTNHEN